MSFASKHRKIGSPWRCGPGILRVPDDANRVARLHHANKLKWRLFRRWQLIAIRSRIHRMLHEAIELRYERALVARMFRRWLRRVQTRKCLQHICGQVQRLRLNTFDAIWAQCRRFGQLSTRTAWLVFVVRFSQMKLCRRVLHIWRSRIEKD